MRIDVFKSKVLIGISILYTLAFTHINWVILHFVLYIELFVPTYSKKWPPQKLSLSPPDTSFFRAFIIIISLRMNITDRHDITL
jgi:hypothetical protein